MFNENEVRVAAGLTMIAGAVAFVYANFEKVFVPIRVVTIVFSLEFLIRLTVGLRYSPVGAVSRWMTRRQQPQWVSTKPKRFAWTMGLVMSLAMAFITNSGIHGALPRTICLTCLALMWLEAVPGICLGCELHGLLVRRGWLAKDEAFEICAHDACHVAPATKPRGARAPTLRRLSRNEFTPLSSGSNDLDVRHALTNACCMKPGRSTSVGVRPRGLSTSTKKAGIAM